MNFRRYLCSHLVKLRCTVGESTVNLEEIWQTGAVLESEEAVEEGSRAEIRTDGKLFAGKVAGVEQHELGWRLRIEFSPLTPWRLEEFQPQHLLEVAASEIEAPEIGASESP